MTSSSSPSSSASGSALFSINIRNSSSMITMISSPSHWPSPSSSYWSSYSSSSWSCECKRPLLWCFKACWHIADTVCISTKCIHMRGIKHQSVTITLWFAVLCSYFSMNVGPSTYTDIFSQHHSHLQQSNTCRACELALIVALRGSLRSKAFSPK